MSEFIGNVWIDEKRQQQAEIERLRAQVDDLHVARAEAEDEASALRARVADLEATVQLDGRLLAGFQNDVARFRERDRRLVRLLRDVTGLFQRIDPHSVAPEIDALIRRMDARIRAELDPPADAGPQHEEG